MKPKKPEVWQCKLCDYKHKTGPGLARAKRAHLIKCDHGTNCVHQPCLYCIGGSHTSRRRRRNETRGTMSEKFAKDKAHQIYRTKDGKRVPGTTTITGLRAKPYLITWANNLGLEGIDSTSYRDTRGKVGTLCHYMIQCHVTGVVPDFSEYSPKERDLAENGFIHWLSWESQHGQMEPMLSEKQLVSEAYGYGGTIDLYGSRNGRLTLDDFKTGKAIYDDMVVQVAAYEHLLTENGFRVDDVNILRLGRGDDDNGFDYRTFSRAVLDDAFQIFLHLLAVYQLEKKIKKEGE